MTAQRDDRVALALGAGGARGLAQIGVIEAIEARGLRIASVAGSSSGALVGGVFAAGKLAEFRAGIEALDRGAFLRLLSDPALGDGGLFHGHRLVAAMREVVGDPDIESLPIPFVAVAVDLMRQRVVWLRSRMAELFDRARCGFSVNQLPVLAVAMRSSSGEKRQIVALRRTPPESTASEACMRMS